MAKAKKDLAEQKKMLKQKMAEQREMSKKRKAGHANEDAMTGNAVGDVMALASSHSLEELKRMLADETESLGGMVEDGDNTADSSGNDL